MKKILIVIDMQVDFIDGSLGTEAAVKILPNVANKIENFDGTIVFTRDTHFDDYLDTLEGKNLPVPHCIKGSKGHEIHPKLKRLVGNYVHDKTSFGAKDLPDLIHEICMDDTDIEISLIGVCTDICVISNAMILKAFFPQAKICVYADCCAGVTEKGHLNALEAMKICQIEIKNN